MRLALLLLGLFWALPAAAQPPQRTAGIAFDGGALIDLSVEDFATARVRRRLESGLSQTLEVRAYAYRSSGGPPLAIAVRSCRVVFDLWEEVFRVSIATETSEVSVVVGSLDEVVDRCLVLEDLRIGDAERLRPAAGEEIYLALAVQLNPLTPDTVHRIRRWLARPGGAADPSDTFFGSFVSLFVNRSVGEAEAHLELRTQTVRVPAASPPGGPP